MNYNDPYVIFIFNSFGKDTLNKFIKNNIECLKKMIVLSFIVTIITTMKSKITRNFIEMNIIIYLQSFFFKHSILFLMNLFNVSLPKEYEYYFNIYNETVNRLNNAVYGECIENKFNTSSNCIFLIEFNKFFNLFLAAISIDRIITNNIGKKIRVDLTNEELNFNSRFLNFYGILCERIGAPFYINIVDNESGKQHIEKFDSATKDPISKLLIYDFSLIKFYFRKKLTNAFKKNYILSYGENLINREVKLELDKHKIAVIELQSHINEIFDQKVSYTRNDLRFIHKKTFEEFNKLRSVFKNAFVSFLRK